VPASEIEGAIANAIRKHLGKPEANNSAALIQDHLVRIEVHPERLIIELANTKATDKKRKQRPERISPVAQAAVETPPRNSGARIHNGSDRPPDPLREPRASGRLYRERTSLARRTHRRPYGQR
jgi:hypothetical protein